MDPEPSTPAGPYSDGSSGADTSGGPTPAAEVSKASGADDAPEASDLTGTAGTGGSAESPRSTGSTGVALDPVVRDLVRILTRALRSLGDAGRPNDAAEYGAQAWTLVRHNDPVAARRINGMMHYLAHLPDQTEAPYWARHAPVE